MKVAFRVDASVRIGIGHMMRCLTLAEALRGRGAQLRFICREHEGNLIALLRQKDMPVAVLPVPARNAAATSADYASWLGVSQAEDAEQTNEAINGWKPDWLVADHYGFDIEWEKRLRPHVGGLMVIDDLANRRHDCDVLLDQNYSAEGARRYAGLAPATCKLLIGPRYALLRPEYAAYRKIQNARNGHVSRVFVFFGGTDPMNMTGVALEALSVPELQYLDVDVVVGANNPHHKRIEQQVAQRPRTIRYESRPHLADLMGQADLAVGAGGTTTLERLCLGLPSLVVSIAENQIPSCVALHHAHLINYLGYQDKMDAAGFHRGIVQMIDSPDRLVGMSQDGLALVDGLGVDIISDTLRHNV